MTTNKGTTGPWQVVGQFNDVVESVAGEVVCACHRKSCPADAALIASAPELLATLKELLKESMHRGTDGDLDAIFALIAKAEGRPAEEVVTE